ncbi:DNA-packaging protein FI [Enterobacter hormaechei subsp. hoffmannii]|uniref:DNA-packaging protein FI n=1 Tax=Enterobacter hormaechei TaxID=158836 RepID=UPI0035C60F1B
MAEKDDLLKKLAELGEKLGRDVPTGTNAELKGKIVEWQAELDALDAEDADDGSNHTEDSNNTGASQAGAGAETVVKPAEVVPSSNKSGTPSLVRFTALATLHVNAVSDDDDEIAVVVKGQSARLPEEVFNQLQKRKLVKKV